MTEIASTPRDRHLGVAAVLGAATCWGGSAVWAKSWLNAGLVDVLALSQARVTVSWLLILAYLALRSRRSFVVHARDTWRFLLAGLSGMAGANYLLYDSLRFIEAAVADTIQFTAPALVMLWFALTREESLTRRRVIALALSFAGCALALNLHATRELPAFRGAGTALLSALCYATLLVVGKGLAQRYRSLTYLHYCLLTAALFWCAFQAPWTLAISAWQAGTLPFLLAFAVTSALLPYSMLFAGLRRIPATSAGIVSTWEPVVIAIGAWVTLGESLGVVQVSGIVLVLAAILLVNTERMAAVKAPAQEDSA